MKIRIQYNDGSRQDIEVFGFALDETTKRLDLIVERSHRPDAWPITNTSSQRLEHINWPAVVFIENLEVIR